MMNMEDFNNFLVFRYISDSILEGNKLNETYKFNIYSAKKFIKKTSKSLDLMFDIKRRINENEEFEIDLPIQQVIECCKKDITKISLDDILEVKETLALISKGLDKLKADPMKFYESNEAEKVFDFIEDLLPCLSYIYYN
jgi:hypothetical protein